MRTVMDRIRHALSFEIIGLVLITPLGAWIFSMPLEGIGVVAAVTATIAALWNYLFNYIFDRIMIWWRGDVRKTVTIRVSHAVLFEAGLIILLVPFIASYLGIGILHALTMDISFSLFYVVYAFVFNWAYDLAFPVNSNSAVGDEAAPNCENP